jgi:hypothetical protein
LCQERVLLHTRSLFQMRVQYPLTFSLISRCKAGDQSQLSLTVHTESRYRLECCSQAPQSSHGPDTLPHREISYGIMAVSLPVASDYSTSTPYILQSLSGSRGSSDRTDTLLRNTYSAGYGLYTRFPTTTGLRSMRAP